ncbi:MAG: PLDc N-terminal domain-containing protein [Mycoplasma sp.]|nr:PLDc N-terminal domain-containing protein [Candidatus Hennigella equi]
MNKNKILISGIIAILLLAGIIGTICLLIFVNVIWPLVIVLVLAFILEIAFAFRIAVSPRSSYAKASWMIVILVFPIIGLLTFIIFGVYPVRKRQRKAYLNQLKQIIDYEDFSLSEKIQLDPELNWLFNYGLKHQYKPIYKDNEIKVIPDNTQLFEESINLIRSAKQYINIQSYIFSYSGFWSKVFFTELIKKANEGVKVRLIYDWLGAHKRVNNKIFRDLQEYGVEVACFNPKGLTQFKGATNYRLHSKFIIVDNKTALYGGSNFADEYLSMNRDSCHWKDLNYLITGPIVNSMNISFINYWTVFCKASNTQASRQNVLNDAQLIFSKHKFKSSNTLAQILVFEPDFNEFALENALLHAFYNAKKSIKILTPYFCPPNSIIEALKTCHTHGIDVEIIAHNKNQKYVQMMNRENYKKLADVGIKTYEYDGYLHSKCIIIDDEYVLTGSCNIDWRSIYLDFESELIVYDKKFTQDVLNVYENSKKNSSLQTSATLSEKLTLWYRFLLKLLNFGKSLF